MGAAAAPMIIGSAIGGMMNKRNPLQGALLGGALGGLGGSFMGGLGSAGSGAAGSTMPGVVGGSVAPGAFGAPVLTPTVSTIAPGGTGIFSSLGTPALGGISPAVSGPSTGLIPSALAPAPTFMESVTGGFKDLGAFAQQNPVLTSMAAQTGMSLLNQQPTQPPPPGLMRGNPTQMPPPQYQVGVPQVSLI